MKRKEIVQGADYAVYSPASQSPRYSGRRARVLDVEPVWVKAHRSWSRGDSYPTVKVEGFDGKTVEAQDHTAQADYASERRSARTQVKVLMQASYSDDYVVTLKNVAHIQKPWGEFETWKAAEDKADREQDKRERQRETEKAGTAARLQRRLAEAGIDGASVVNKPYRYSEDVYVKVTAEAFENLLARLTQAEGYLVNEEEA